jgi:hypothetical protein
VSASSGEPRTPGRVARIAGPGFAEAPIFYPAPEKPELTEMEALELRDHVAALDLLRQGVGSDQLRAIAEEGNSRVASALSRIAG